MNHFGPAIMYIPLFQQDVAGFHPQPPIARYIPPQPPVYHGYQQPEDRGYQSQPPVAGYQAQPPFTGNNSPHPHSAGYQPPTQVKKDRKITTLGDGRKLEQVSTSASGVPLSCRKSSRLTRKASMRSRMNMIAKRTRRDDHRVNPPQANRRLLRHPGNLKVW